MMAGLSLSESGGSLMLNLAVSLQAWPFIKTTEPIAYCPGNKLFNLSESALGLEGPIASLERSLIPKIHSSGCMDLL